MRSFFANHILYEKVISINIIIITKIYVVVRFRPPQSVKLGNFKEMNVPKI